jgi:hypothetical protein
MSRALEALDRAMAALQELRGYLTAPADDAPPARALTATDLADAAAALGVDVAKVQAVSAVESGRLGGFGPDGRPIILFEPHVFSRLTAHRYDKTHGGVSYPSWGAKPYPATQAERWAQLDYAAKLDRKAALQSASYGRFQIMGFNFAACGFADVEAFCDAMHTNERAHLMAFVAFVQSNGLADELQRGDWLGFARGFNGPGQGPAYAQKLEAAYRAAA